MRVAARSFVLLLASSCSAQELGSCAPVAGALLPDGTTPDPCLFQCAGETLHRFHLEPVAASATSGYVRVTGDQGKSYYFGACGPVTGVTCVGTTVVGPPAAIQAWGGSPPKIDSDSCAILGSTDNRNCSLSQSVAGSGLGPGMMCNYTGGTGGRSFAVHYKCNNGPMSLAATQTGTSTYLITVSGEEVCGVVYTPPLSWGSLTLIFFFVGATLYVSAGVAYNVKVRERKPTLATAFPQYAYWKQLPGLVRDGCQLSYEESVKAYYRFQGTAPPLDSSLKRRLQEDDDGGGGDPNT